ncbi:uncharacterized protein LOC134233670 [Saccostrea cucullata]|uniref:uncharacterized protein LOC134233670 n=1 Tax=Saccostrea cuccullata TaxID=36930 RepID=UPI002ED1C19D
MTSCLHCRKTLDLGFISSDEFLVKDIQGEGFRHIVFATRYQLELLSETKIWYMDDIPAAFETLKERANTEPLQSLVNYFDRQWIHHAIFRPSSWTVYQQSVRTNNDVEGWHHRVNGKAGHRSCTFYKLVPLLLQEAKLVETRVSSDNLLRNVRHSSNATQKKLDTAWEQYDAGDISTGHFLRLCGSLYAPCE